jgi:hypothetical protein
MAIPEAETATATATLTRATGSEAARIQPCGFLVVVGQDWRVMHVSANIADHFADCGARMVGQPLSDFFGAAPVHALRNQLSLMRDPQGCARTFSLFFAGVPKPFDVALHACGHHIIVEALPSAHIEAGDPAGMARQLAAQLDDCATQDEMLGRACRFLRALTGFDSVAIYRTGADGEARCVAEESRGPSLAASCPQPELRLLADSARGPVALEPEAPAALLDRALLRPWSDHDGAAAAALALPLRSASRPWGVAVCLSASRRRPALDRIAAAELFAELLALRAELYELRRG